MKQSFWPAQTAAAKPHAVVVSPEQDLVLLAVEPSAASAVTATQQQAAAAGDADAAAPAAEVFDANPRSLQQAVENLARFTSDQPAVAAQMQVCLGRCEPFFMQRSEVRPDTCRWHLAGIWPAL